MFILSRDDFRRGLFVPRQFRKFEKASFLCY